MTVFCKTLCGKIRKERKTSGPISFPAKELPSKNVTSATKMMLNLPLKY
jgi:hypothetical protein